MNLGITGNHKSIAKENILRRAFVRLVTSPVILKNNTRSIWRERIIAKELDGLSC